MLICSFFRYSELQREMQRKVEELQGKDAYIENLKGLISEHENDINKLKIRLEEAESTLMASQEQALLQLDQQRSEAARLLENEQQARQQSNDNNTSIVSNLQLQLKAREDEIERLRSENCELEEQVAAGLDNKKSLEEYKSRAQKALKKVRG